MTPPVVYVKAASGLPQKSTSATARCAVFHPVRAVWCHLLHCSAVSLLGEGESSMPINATGGTGELVTSVPRPDRGSGHRERDRDRERDRTQTRMRIRPRNSYFCTRVITNGSSPFMKLTSTVVRWPSTMRTVVASFRPWIMTIIGCSPAGILVRLNRS